MLGRDRSTDSRHTICSSITQPELPADSQATLTHDPETGTWQQVPEDTSAGVGNHKKHFKPTRLEVHFHQNCLLYLPSAWTLKCSVGLTETMLTWDFRSWKISFSCSLLVSQSTKISNSEFRLLDFRDSMCTRFTCFSCLVRSNVLKEIG